MSGSALRSRDAEPGERGSQKSEIGNQKSEAGAPGLRLLLFIS